MNYEEDKDELLSEDSSYWRLLIRLDGLDMPRQTSWTVRWPSSLIRIAEFRFNRNYWGCRRDYDYTQMHLVHCLI